MTNLFDIFSALSVLQLGVGLAITAAAVAIVIDWRLALFSILLQYLFLSLLLGTAVPEGMAMIKLIAGAIACLILYWTARRLGQGLDTISDGRTWFHSNRDIYPMGLPFRFLALLFTSLVLFTLPQRFSFSMFSQTFLVSAFWLMAMGLLTIILTRDPLKSGMGLLSFQNGFELLYTPLEPGLLVLGLLGIATILVGLVASYLAVARYLPLFEERKVVVTTAPAADPRSPQALAEAVAALEQAPSEPEQKVPGEQSEPEPVRSGEVSA